MRYMTCINLTQLSFVGDYDDIAPGGHTNMELDIDAARRACKVLSKYNGEQHIPLEV